MSIKNVIFDFGGVLIKWDPHVIYIEEFGDEEKARWFIKNICTAEWNATLDKGKPFSVGVEEKIREHPEYEKEIRLYKDRWKDTILGEIPGSVKILEQINKSGTFKLFGITNWSYETFPYALSRFHFLHYFEDIVVSGKVKMIKPFDDIFLYALKRFNIKAAETVFIDDNRANIETARRLGFQSVHFRDSETLSKELKSIGVIDQ